MTYFTLFVHFTSRVEVTDHNRKTAQIEPVSSNEKIENLYFCYTVCQNANLET